MPQYIVFPVPEELAIVDVSSVKVARNKYRKAMPDMNERELIIVPAAFAQKTNMDDIMRLLECGFKEI